MKVNDLIMQVDVKLFLTVKELTRELTLGALAWLFFVNFSCWKIPNKEFETGLVFDHYDEKGFTRHPIL